MQKAAKALFLMLILFALSGLSFAGHLESISHTAAGTPSSAAAVELGKKLFFDRRLSGDGTMSCATCHIPEIAFTDGMDISLSYPTTRNWRNSPSVLNLAESRYLFWDGRAVSLEDQALFPMMSAFEMNQNLDFLEEEIAQVPEYASTFTAIYGGRPTRERIALALAAFERTLVSGPAPIDAYLNGKKSALSTDALLGYEIFTGKGKCSDCHYGKYLSDEKFYALGVPENPKLVNDPGVRATMRFVAKVYHYERYAELGEDPGRYLITKDMKDWKAFRTPMLRDAARTAPYMHNGVFQTLEEVVDFFDRGGGPGNTALKPLGLTNGEKEALKTFMVEALSGEEQEFKYPKVP